MPLFWATTNSNHCILSPFVCVSHLACLTLRDPIDCSLTVSSVHGILQARILEWVAIPSPGDLPDPGIEPMSRMIFLTI